MNDIENLQRQLRNIDALLAQASAGAIDPARYDQCRFRNDRLGLAATFCLGGWATELGIGGLYWPREGWNSVPHVFVEGETLTGSLAMEHVFGKGAYDAVFAYRYKQATESFYTERVWRGDVGLKQVLAALGEWRNTMGSRLSAAVDEAARLSSNAVTDTGNDDRVTVQLDLPQPTLLFLDHVAQVSATTREVVANVMLAAALHREAVAATDALAAEQSSPGEHVVTPEQVHAAGKKLYEDLTKPVPHDTRYLDDNGRVIVSIGARRETDTDTVPCHPDLAQFWSVFTHARSNGHASILCDCTDRASAERVADHIVQLDSVIASLRRHNESQHSIIERQTDEIAQLRTKHETLRKQVQDLF